MPVKRLTIKGYKNNIGKSLSPGYDSKNCIIYYYKCWALNYVTAKQQDLAELTQMYNITFVKDTIVLPAGTVFFTAKNCYVGDKLFVRCAKKSNPNFALNKFNATIDLDNFSNVRLEKL